jgi:Na+/phosphate symporter
VAEASETLVKILESITNTNAQLIDILTRMEQRQQENSLALAQVIGENTRLLAKGIEDNSQALARMLERVVQTTDRTERMTAGILARLTQERDPAH